MYMDELFGFDTSIAKRDDFEIIIDQLNRTLKKLDQNVKILDEKLNKKIEEKNLKLDKLETFEEMTLFLFKKI